MPCLPRAFRLGAIRGVRSITAHTNQEGQQMDPNTTLAALTHIAATDDVTHVGEWDDYDTGRWSRCFTGTRHHRGVTVIGVQHDDGTVGRLVAVHCDDELTPAAARQLAPP